MEADELRSQLRRVVGKELDGDRGQFERDTFNALGPSLRQWPSLGIEYAQLTLELKIAEQVLAFLSAQLEDAKYRQAQDAPTLQVSRSCYGARIQECTKSGAHCAHSHCNKLGFWNRACLLF